MAGWALHLGDCRAELPKLGGGSVDCVVTDPPYNLAQIGRSLQLPRSGPGQDYDRAEQRNGRERGFMGCEWDNAVAFRPEVWAECLRVAKAGAYLLAFGGTRTHHRLMCAVEDAGWELTDTLCWLYGCLSDDTEILTDKGWELYRKVETGSLALGYNLGDDTFRWEPIEEVLTYDYCDTAYRIQSGRTDQLVSRNHRCLVERGGGYAFEYAEALQREVRVPVVEDVRGLLAALPLPQRHAGPAEQGVFYAVRGGEVCGGKDGRPAGREGRAGDGGLCGVREGVASAHEGGRQDGQADVQPSVQRHPSREGVGQARAQRPGRMDGRECTVPPPEDERAEQPGVEGRGDGLQDSRPLRRGEVRPLPGRPVADGPEGRLRDGAPLDRGAGDGAVTGPGGGGPPRRPRPDEQCPGQSHALCLQPRPQTARVARHTTADLAWVEPVHYAGVVWCVRVPSGAFVARRNGKVFVTGNSGFPKAKSCLKPAWEPIVLARKPAPRVAPLGIDECRVATAETLHGSTVRNDIRGGNFANGHRPNPGDIPAYAQSPAGRYPANLVLSHHEACVCQGTRRVRGGNSGPNPGGTGFALCGNGPKGRQGYADPEGMEAVEDCVCHPGCPVRLLDEQAGERKSGHLEPHHKRYGSRLGVNTYGVGAGETASGGRSFGGDTGSASRFFFCAKASRADRGEGNDHKTVKPTALMAWLVKLACPAGGLVLDPFTGSASTGVACLRGGRRFIGIERDPHYFEIARRRLADVDGPLFANAPAVEEDPT